MCVGWLMALGCESGSSEPEGLGGLWGASGGSDGAGEAAGGNGATGGTGEGGHLGGAGSWAGGETGGAPASSGGGSSAGGAPGGGESGGGAGGSGGTAGDGGSNAGGGGAGGGAGGQTVVQNCTSFEDRTQEAADRFLLWTQDIAADPERCMQILVGQSVIWTGNFAIHPLLPSGGDMPTPISDFPASGDHAVTFPNEGTFGFPCEVHGEMRGAIRVVAP